MPGSDTTINFTDWAYDYSTRTYQLTVDSGTYYVTYGDEYLTISDGTTSTNYYYVVPSGDSGGGSGGDSDDPSWLQSILEAISTATLAIVAKLDTLAAGTVTNITNLTTNITNNNSAYNVFYVTDSDGNSESIANVAGSSVKVIGKLTDFLYKAVFKGALLF